MSDYVKRATKFINLFVTDMKLTNKKRSDYHTMIRIVCDFNATHQRRVQIARGASRICLISSDYVVKWDYDYCGFGGCEDECQMYEIAEAEGYAYLFAKPTPIEVKGMTFYIMPRIRNIGRKTNIEDRLNEEEWDFVNAHIRDLHYRNYGFRDEMPIIVDYAAVKDGSSYCSW